MASIFWLCKFGRLERPAGKNAVRFQTRSAGRDLANFRISAHSSFRPSHIPNLRLVHILYDIQRPGEPMGRFPTQSLHDHWGDVRHGSRFSLAGSSHLQRDLGANDLPGFRLPLPGFRTATVFHSTGQSTVAWLDRLGIPRSSVFLESFLANESLHHRERIELFPILHQRYPAYIPIEKAGCSHEGRERKIRGRSLSYLLRLRGDR